MTEARPALQSATATVLAWSREFSIANSVGEIVSILLVTPLLLTVALWNGFPIIFYDTGAYILEGLGHVFVAERSPVYSLLLLYGNAGYSLWLVAALQAGITSFAIVEFARAETPSLSVLGLIFVVILLVLLTGIAWYVGQIEPDAFTAVAVIAIYLLSFRAGVLGVARCALLAAAGALSIAVHASHLALAVGLVVAVFVVRGIALISASSRLPRPGLLLPSVAVAGAAALVLASNHELTGRYFISRSGPVFAFARMLQDGLVKRLLDESCPASGYRLCAYRSSLPSRADGFLWDADSPFNKLGRFYGPTDEYRRIVLESLLRYPLANVQASLRDTALQFVMVRTGDQIEPQEWILYSDLEHYIPSQMDAYMSARQQQGQLRFATLNLVHVGVALISVLALVALLGISLRRRDPPGAALTAFIILALLGNAFVCGVLSNPHDRYQSRLIWLSTLVCLLFLPRAASPLLAKHSRIRHLMADG